MGMESKDRNFRVVYYWYHHMIDNNIRKDIQSAIDNGDYEKFIMYCEKLNTTACTFLPNEAYIYYGNDCIGEIDVTCNKDVISFITCSESECG